jgi:hypothetical protein
MMQSETDIVASSPGLPPLLIVTPHLLPSDIESLKRCLAKGYLEHNGPFVIAGDTVEVYQLTNGRWTPIGEPRPGPVARFFARIGRRFHPKPEPR